MIWPKVTAQTVSMQEPSTPAELAAMAHWRHQVIVQRLREGGSGIGIPAAFAPHPVTAELLALAIEHLVHSAEGQAGLVGDLVVTAVHETEDEDSRRAALETLREHLALPPQ